MGTGVSSGHASFDALDDVSTDASADSTWKWLMTDLEYHDDWRCLGPVVGNDGAHKRNRLEHKHLE